MKQEELRIGNLITYYEDKPPFPCGINDLLNPELILPIRLTEEWLVNLGFVKEDTTPVSEKHSYYFSRPYNDCKLSFSYASFREDWGFYHSYTDALSEEDNNKYDFISCGIKYVHELQNIYYCLTQTELVLAVAGSVKK